MVTTIPTLCKSSSSLLLLLPEVLTLWHHHYDGHHYDHHHPITALSHHHCHCHDNHCYHVTSTIAVTVTITSKHIWHLILWVTSFPGTQSLWLLRSYPFLHILPLLKSICSFLVDSHTIWYSNCAIGNNVLGEMLSRNMCWEKEQCLVPAQSFISTWPWTNDVASKGFCFLFSRTLESLLDPVSWFWCRSSIDQANVHVGRAFRAWTVTKQTGICSKRGHCSCCCIPWGRCQSQSVKG